MTWFYWYLFIYLAIILIHGAYRAGRTVERANLPYTEIKTYITRQVCDVVEVVGAVRISDQTLRTEPLLLRETLMNGAHREAVAGCIERAKSLVVMEFLDLHGMPLGAEPLNAFETTPLVLRFDRRIREIRARMKVVRWHP